MNELIAKIKELNAALVADAELQVAKGNKAAGTRARKASLELEKVLKEFRKVSLEESKKESFFTLSIRGYIISYRRCDMASFIFLSSSLLFLRNELCTFVVNRMFPYESSNVYIDNKLHGHLWNVV